MKIKKGDNIIVTVGKDRGRNGRVERIFPEQELVLVPGLNEYKRHRKPQGQDRPGEIAIISRPLASSKVAIVCPRCKQPTRVGYRLDGAKKIRICRKCDNDLDVKITKPKAKIKK